MKTKSIPIVIVTLLILFLASAPTALAKGKGGKGGKGGNGEVVESAPSDPLIPNSVDKVMRIYDTNKDGKLTPDEITRLAKLEPATAKLAKNYDYDGSSMLEADEISHWRNEVGSQNRAAADKPSKDKSKK